MSKIVKVQVPDGRVIKVEGPDDATDEQFIEQGRILYAQMLPNGSETPAAAESSLRGAMPPPGDPAILAAQAARYPTAAEQGGLRGQAVQNSLIRGFAEEGRNNNRALFNAMRDPMDTANHPERQIITGMDDPSVALISAAIPGGAATETMGIGQAAKESPLVAALRKLIPSKARAGANLDLIRAALADKSPDLSNAYSAVQRGKELTLAGHGPVSTGMKVLDEAMQPATFDAMGTPLTVNPPSIKYPQSFDMASAAKSLAANESGQMTNMMQGQVKQFARALQEGNRALAAENGLGPVFDQAMKEYRHAKSLEEAAAITKKWAVKGAIGLLLAGQGARLVNDLRK